MSVSRTVTNIKFPVEVHGPPEQLYKKVVSPGLDVINHANKLGIRLKSTSALRCPQSAGLHSASRSPRQGRVKSSPQRGMTQSPASPQYIQNVVIPLPSSSEDSHSHSSFYKSLTEIQRAMSGSKVTARSVPLPSVRNSARLSRARTANTMKSTRTPLHSDRYLSTTPSERMTQLHDDDMPKWNTSDQAVRFQMEQRNMARSRTLKRLSEVQSHRMDRMYYLSANTAPIHAKYDVDQEELRRLKDLSRARRQSPHYGRGLSHRSSESKNAADLESPHRIRTPATTPQPHAGHSDIVGNVDTFLTQQDADVNDDTKQGAHSEVDSLASLPPDSARLLEGEETNMENDQEDQENKNIDNDVEAAEAEVADIVLEDNAEVAANVLKDNETVKAEHNVNEKEDIGSNNSNESVRRSVTNASNVDAADQNDKAVHSDNNVES